MDRKTPKPLTIFASFPASPLTDSLPNGDGLVAYDFVAALAARGHKVHIATSYAVLRDPLPSGVTLHTMLPSSAKARPGRLAYMRWIRKTLNQVRRSVRVDIIHELNPVFSMLSLAFAGSGLPVVLGPHSSRWPPDADLRSPSARAPRTFDLANWFKASCVRVQHRQAQAILLSTPAALNNVQEPEQLLQRLFILPPGIDDEQYRPDAAEHPSGHSSTILYLANLATRKGIFTLLKAFDTVAEAVPEARLLIAGSGTELPDVQQTVNSSPYGGRIEFLGNVSRAAVSSLMRKPAVYCLPSHGEPFGMSALEAMASGKPLVVTNAGGLGYMVSDRGGRKVPVRNPEALASALVELLLNPKLAQEMGIHNREQVRNLYAWDRVAERLENIYDAVLTGSAAAKPDQIKMEDVVRYRKLSEEEAASPAMSNSRATSKRVASGA